MCASTVLLIVFNDTAAPPAISPEPTPSAVIALICPEFDAVNPTDAPAAAVFSEVAAVAARLMAPPEAFTVELLTYASTVFPMSLVATAAPAAGPETATERLPASDSIVDVSVPLMVTPLVPDT